MEDFDIMSKDGLEHSNIHINNFGIINDANINIAPLTIFIGPNSSGKSFVAKLIHSFSKVPEININESLLIQEAMKNFDEDDCALFDEINHNINKYNKSNPSINSEPFKLTIDDFQQILVGGIYKFFSKLVEERIKEQFEVELDELINFNKQDFSIKVNSNEFFKTSSELKFNQVEIPLERNVIMNNNPMFRFDLRDEYILINMDSMLINELENERTDFILMILYGIISKFILQNLLLENSYYIPAERSEIIMDKKLLTRNVSGKSDLSKNQSEVLANILNIDTSKKSVFYDLGCDFEREFSGIVVDIKNDVVFNEIVYKNIEQSNEISPKLLSTSIHEMSMFSLYLKYILKEGDLLIIEEPEAHLHPKNQRIFVKYLIKAINKGLKVMFTTHSDYIVNQINNFIGLGNISTEDLYLLDYDVNDVLDFGDVNIYHFKINDDNSYSSEKIEINEYGFTEENFSCIATELYDETIQIDNLSSR